MRPILTAARMRAAEAQTIAQGTSETLLMERAGAALAAASLRVAGVADTLILSGPGNNGGDGHVAARHLAARGVRVTVASLGEPGTSSGRWARSLWNGAVEPFEAVRPAPILIDCLFGTGLRRGLDDVVAQRLSALREAASVAIACDLPSGVESDTGALLSAVPSFDATLTFGALKPAHRLMPSMTQMGRLILGDIGVTTESEWFEIEAPNLPPLDPAGHKFDRGMVVVLAGAMPGAAALAASAAARGGAGYVRLIADRVIANVPAAVAQEQGGALDDPRIGALLIGPGLGRHSSELLDKALASGRPLVLDADALHLLDDPRRLSGLDAIVTPHAGEFAALFGTLPGSRPEQALAAACMADAVIVMKGPDTLVASPDGRLGFAPPAPSWLASAGTGDVLAGLAAACRARGLAAFEAACAAVWLHGRAAERAGPGMIADDLVAALRVIP
jgi:hydroxyethylthiazole kinase-like uncharacterized protein yjeF